MVSVPSISISVLSVDVSLLLAVTGFVASGL